MSTEKRKVFDALWTKMVEEGDFPTLTHSIRNIVTAVQSRDDHLEKIVSAVISDFSLTQKVLRLANSAMYAPFGGNVTTVSRAVLVLGQETVGHLALGLRLLDSFKGMTAERKKAKHLLAEAMLTGLVARRLTEHVGIKEGEEAAVCALLSRLGELVCVFYAPQDWERIEARMADVDVTADEAARQVLGVTFSEIGQDISFRWGLPGRLREALRPFDPDAVEEPLTHAEWLRAMSAFSGELARAMASGAPGQAAAAAERYTPLLALDVEAMHATLEQLHAEAQTKGGWEGIADVYSEKPGREASGKPADAEARLAAGVAEIARSAPECQIPVLLHMALEVMQNALGCTRVIAFLPEPSSGRYSARAGFGTPKAGDLTALSFEGGFAPDVFHLTLSSRTPVHIADTGDAKIRSRIPAWHRDALGDAHSMMLLPIVVKGRALALLYADWTSPSVTPLTPTETQMLKRLVHELESVLTAASPGGAVSAPAS
ncbi:MAG: HDOD domain-containing protein [Rhodospirillaceae bacterium]